MTGRVTAEAPVVCGQDNMGLDIDDTGFRNAFYESRRFTSLIKTSDGR